MLGIYGPESIIKLATNVCWIAWLLLVEFIDEKDLDNFNIS